MQLHQSKTYSITIVFRSWSCSSPPVEVADQSAAQNSQTVLVALLSLMQLMKVSNAGSGGESNVCFIVSVVISLLFWGGSKTARAQGIFHSTCKSMQICCLSYILSISAVQFHEEWVVCFPCGYLLISE